MISKGKVINKEINKSLSKYDKILLNKMKREGENIMLLEKEEFHSQDHLRTKLFGFFQKNNIISQPVFVVDIHNTTEFNEGEIDKDVSDFIERYSGTYNFIFLSYDGQFDRMIYNANALNKHSETFNRIPKMFIKRRDKGIILKHLKDYILSQQNYEEDKLKIVFVDDNTSNIKDAEKYLDDKESVIFNYTKYSKHCFDHPDLNELEEIIIKKL